MIYFIKKEEGNKIKDIAIERKYGEHIDIPENQYLIVKRVLANKSEVYLDEDGSIRFADSEVVERIRKTMYDFAVARKINTKYSHDDQIAILYDKATKPDKYEMYKAFREECKAQAHLEIYGEE